MRCIRNKQNCGKFERFYEMHNSYKDAHKHV